MTPAASANGITSYKLLQYKVRLSSVDPRSSPVAHAAGRSPITHSHSTANIQNKSYTVRHTQLQLIHKLGLLEGTIKEVEWSLHQRLQLIHKLGLLDGTMEGVGWSLFHHVFNATMGRHCFTTLSTTKIHQICAGFW